jgi:methylmalonyl-CoA/ethylmalonyl-CoA epimerase
LIGKVDHIGIAVKNVDEAIKLYTDILGLQVAANEVIEEQKVRTVIIQIGESKIELLESTDPLGVISKFIEKRGEGLHHIALGVDRLEETLKVLKGKGVSLIDEKPRRGVQDTRVAFLHPKGTKILLELVEIR